MNFYLILVLLTALSLNLSGCFWRSQPEKWQSDEPLYLELRESIRSRQSDPETLKQIIHNYVPLGTPLEEALATFKTNAFSCEQYKDKHPRSPLYKYKLNFLCSIGNIEGPLGFSSTTAISLGSNDNKVEFLQASYGVHGF